MVGDPDLARSSLYMVAALTISRDLERRAPLSSAALPRCGGEMSCGTDPAGVDLGEDQLDRTIPAPIRMWPERHVVHVAMNRPVGVSGLHPFIA